jgi:hypothetical protein
VVKLVLTWDIQRGKTTQYVEFTVSEFFPALTRQGMTITDMWSTMVGGGPQILVAGTLPSMEAAQRLLFSSEYGELKRRLMQYIDNYAYAIRPA